MAKEIKISERDRDFIWGLIVGWAKEVPGMADSYDPIWFGTLSRNGDIEVHKKLCDILDRPYNIIQ